ncbi:MAG: hypothetical protein C4576_13620 [Desulfobacteraceae bacterium]|nr:MAG: hypothetical protein C4576_13620 [Desulfobacteraceae bacterium]
MALSTFGAIMTFAADMFQFGEEVLLVSIQNAKNPLIRDILDDLIADQRKSRSLMERVRRENVTEMILEPINGLSEEEYDIKAALISQPQNADPLTLATIIEERQQRFFQDCSTKIPMAEVARLFKKISQTKEQALMRLRS